MNETQISVLWGGKRMWKRKWSKSDSEDWERVRGRSSSEGQERLDEVGLDVRLDWIGTTDCWTCLPAQASFHPAAARITNVSGWSPVIDFTTRVGSPNGESFQCIPAAFPPQLPQLYCEISQVEPGRRTVTAETIEIASATSSNSHRIPSQAIRCLRLYCIHFWWKLYKWLLPLTSFSLKLLCRWFPFRFKHIQKIW